MEMVLVKKTGGQCGGNNRIVKKKKLFGKLFGSNLNIITIAINTFYNYE